MGMHRIAPGCKVLHVDRDNVIDLRAQYWPQEAQPLRPVSLCAVCSVRVLPEHGLLINTANLVGSFFQEHSRLPEIETEKHGRCRHSRGFTHRGECGGGGGERDGNVVGKKNFWLGVSLLKPHKQDVCPYLVMFFSKLVLRTDGHSRRHRRWSHLLLIFSYHISCPMKDLFV